MDNLSTVRYDATRENVSRGRAWLQAPSLTSLSFIFFFSHARREFVSFPRVPDFRALAKFYKIDGGRDVILVVDIYRCDEDDFQKEKKKKLHVSLVDGRIVKFRTRYETLDYFKEFGVIGIDLVDNSDLN